MTRAHLFAAATAVTGTLAVTPAAIAQTPERVELLVRAGTPLRVALDETVAIKKIGQTVSGTLVEPLYAYDRLVLPIGAHIVGHVASLENPSKLARLRAWSGGDFAPKRHAVLQFDSVTRDGATVSLQALGLNATANVRRHVAVSPKPRSAEEPKSNGTVARARQEISQRAHESIAAAKQKASETIAAIKEPGKAERVKSMLIAQLPYHRQYLNKGTVYDAQLQAPMEFGGVEPAALAVAGTLPAPSSILRARLATSLDSAKTTRGSRLEAVVTEPVFSADHQLILPEGTRLTGEVTVARPARRFHRNGQLRFLFDSVETPQREATTLKASLHSVDASADDHLAVDEEGGARATDSKTRFVAPALALMALAGASDGHEHQLDQDDAGFGTGALRQGGGNPGSQLLGGFLGFGLIGAGVARLSHPLGIAFAAVGVARTMYSNVLGKGQDVRFVADTPVELRLAPGPSPAR
jgi:hypothetical protein